MTATDGATCSDHIAEPIRTGGGVHRCVLPAVHVFEQCRDVAWPPNGWHRCDCGAQWCDDQQVDEAQRRDGEGN